MQYAICNVQYAVQLESLMCSSCTNKTHSSPLADCCTIEPSCIPVNTLSHTQQAAGQTACVWVQHTL